MQIGFEATLISIFLVLPGFFATSVQRTTQNIRGWYTEPAPMTWAAISLLRSVVLNVFCLIILLIFISPVNLDKEISSVKNQVSALKIKLIIEYVVILYISGLFWGIVSGFANSFEIHKRIFIKGWTNVSPNPNVWNAVVDSIFRTPKNLSLRGRGGFQGPMGQDFNQ